MPIFRYIRRERESALEPQFFDLSFYPTSDPNREQLDVSMAQHGYVFSHVVEPAAEPDRRASPTAPRSGQLLASPPVREPSPVRATETQMDPPRRSTPTPPLVESPLQSALGSRPSGPTCLHLIYVRRLQWSRVRCAHLRFR